MAKARPASFIIMSDIIYRLILADWAKESRLSESTLPDTKTGSFTEDELKTLNAQGYNCYYFLNTPKDWDGTADIHGSDIQVFPYTCVDMDLKEGKYSSKEEFLNVIAESDITPSFIVDSGNGVHVYWKVNDLDAMSYLRLQRRLIAHYKTDKAVSKIYQLMRVPGTYNVKAKDHFKLCEVLYSSEKEYTCEEMDALLPKISPADEEYCQNHYNMTYNISVDGQNADDAEVPLKFQAFMRENPEAKKLFFGPVKDRSAANFRLGHLLYAAKFTKEEARAVLLNTDKAITRAGRHRWNYANNIVEKIWSFEEVPEDIETKAPMSESMLSILSKSPEDVGYETRLYGHPMFDATKHGFRLGEVLGLIGGSGAGKTALSLNFFKWFVERNPDYIHVFVTLEMPKIQIAERWSKLADDNRVLHEKVHVLSQHDENGICRELTLDAIKNDILSLEKQTGKKVGCVVIDHIGCLDKEPGRTDIEKLMNACRSMKTFALATKTFLVMQSQSSRAKAGWGDIEIEMDAAFGTTKFENYCDYVMTTWQPLRRVQHDAKLYVTAFKYCKIRELNVEADKIKLNQVYGMIFDKETESLRKIVKDELPAIAYWGKQADQERKRDKKEESSEVKEMDWVADGPVKHNTNKGSPPTT